jgi:hypothetical protein
MSDGLLYIRLISLSHGLKHLLYCFFAVIDYRHRFALQTMLLGSPTVWYLGHIGVSCRPCTNKNSYVGFQMSLAMGARLCTILPRSIRRNSCNSILSKRASFKPYRLCNIAGSSFLITLCCMGSVVKSATRSTGSTVAVINLISKLLFFVKQWF